ncbi:MAG: Tm-1-like ATP-binding domain-containing protein, partial [Candidatus Planktophila sp.]
KSRPIYDHNPEFALARCTQEEMGRIGAYFAECANTSVGPVEIVIPGEGYSIPNVPGGVFWDRQADATFEAELMKNINPEIPVEKLPLHANSDEFGIAVAQRFLSLISVREK